MEFGFNRLPAVLFICQVLVHPLGSFVDTRRVWLKTLPCWLCALVFATPQLFIFVQVEEPHPGTGDDSPLRPTLACKSAGYTAEWQRKAYFTFLTAYILVVPTVVMVYCYASISRVIWRPSNRGVLFQVEEVWIPGVMVFRVEEVWALGVVFRTSSWSTATPASSESSGCAATRAWCWRGVRTPE